MPRCSTKDDTSARCARCIESWLRALACVSDAISFGIRTIRTAAARCRAKPSLVVGHHEAARSGQVELLLLVRHPRYLQPLRRRLDGRAPGERRVGASPRHRDMQEGARRAWPARIARRPRTLDD